MPKRKIPDYLKCPIGEKLMETPVTPDCCGHSFDESVLANNVTRGSKVCPIDKKPYTQYHENINLSQAVAAFKQSEKEIENEDSLTRQADYVELLGTIENINQVGEAYRVVANIVRNINKLKDELSDAQFKTLFTRAIYIQHKSISSSEDHFKLNKPVTLLGIVIFSCDNKLFELMCKILLKLPTNLHDDFWCADYFGKTCAWGLCENLSHFSEIYFCYLEMLAKADKNEFIQLLSSTITDWATNAGRQKRTVLHEICKTGNDNYLSTLLNLMVHYLTDEDLRKILLQEDAHGESAIHITCKKGKRDSVFRMCQLYSLLSILSVPYPLPDITYEKPFIFKKPNDTIILASLLKYVDEYITLNLEGNNIHISWIYSFTKCPNLLKLNIKGISFKPGLNYVSAYIQSKSLIDFQYDAESLPQDVVGQLNNMLRTNYKRHVIGVAGMLAKYGQQQSWAINGAIINHILQYLLDDQSCEDSRQPVIRIADIINKPENDSTNNEENEPTSKRPRLGS